MSEIKTIKLEQAVDDYIAFVRDNYHCDPAQKYEQHIFELAVTTFYGEEIWDWINKKIDESGNG